MGIDLASSIVGLDQAITDLAEHTDVEFVNTNDKFKDTIDATEKGLKE